MGCSAAAFVAVAFTAAIAIPPASAQAADVQVQIDSFGVAPQRLTPDATTGKTLRPYARRGTKGWIALHRPDGKAVASPAGRTPQPQVPGGGGSRQNATDGGHLGWLPDPRVLTRQARSGSDRVPGESGAG